MVFIKLKKPLYFSIMSGVILALILYTVPIGKSLELFKHGITDTNTINLILAFYSITFIQRMLEKKNFINLAEQTLDNIFNSKRVNIMLAPFIIGLLPSVSAVLIAAPIVKNSAGDSLSTEEKAFVTSYYRHISEAFLPTYASILLALNLSGIQATRFVFAMLPIVAILFILGYVFYVKKIPKTPVSIENKNVDKIREFKKLLIYLWPIIAVITLILGFSVPVWIASLTIIVLFAIIHRFTLKELFPMIRGAFEVKLILSTVCIMIFSKVLAYVGIITRLPTYFEHLSLHPVIVFGLIFLASTLIAGSQATIALVIPMAFAAIPDGGVSMMVFLMSLTYIAMQISPTHICLLITAEYYNITFIDLVRKTMPVLVSFLVITIVYSWLLYIVF